MLLGAEALHLQNTLMVVQVWGWGWGWVQEMMEEQGGEEGEGRREERVGWEAWDQGVWKGC